MLLLFFIEITFDIVFYSSDYFKVLMLVDYGMVLIRLDGRNVPGSVVGV